MNELISIINTEIQKVRYGEVICTITMHEGQPRVVTVTSTKKHNLVTKTRGANHGKDESM